MSAGSTVFSLLANPTVLFVWALLVGVALVALFLDVAAHDRSLSPLMALVWTLTVLYSGPLGFAVYRYAGPPRGRDSDYRQGFRSTAHCYAGCGAGEVAGLVLAVGVLHTGNLGTAAITFVFAYVVGFSLTVVPMMSHGVQLVDAVTNSVYTETASIVTMEVVAISVDRFLTDGAAFGTTVFWTGLVVSLTVGLLAAYPVNVYLAKKGVTHAM